MNNLITRAISGLFYVSLIALLSLCNPAFYIVGLSLLFLLCLWELQKILAFGSKFYIFITFIVGGLLLYTYAYKFYLGTGYYPLGLQSLLPPLLFLLANLIIFIRPQEIYSDSSKFIFSVAYLALPFALAFTINRNSDFDTFPTPLFLIFCLIWFSDTFAYLTGSVIGKTPFTKISKNKTLEGLLGGFFSVILLGIFIEHSYPNLRGNWIIISIIIGIFAPIGDLAESKIKRVFGVKDSGNLIPGHGGFLDRLDSFLMVSVVTYTYSIIF